MSTNETDIGEGLFIVGASGDDTFNGFDISEQLEAARAEDEGTVVPINGINGKPAYIRQGETIVPVTITVTGVNSRRYKAEEEAIRRRKLSKITHQKFHDDSIEKAAACTLDWTGILNKGQPVRCDRVNAAQIYKLFPHILEQVTEAMNDHALFSPGSSPTP